MMATDLGARPGAYADNQLECGTGDTHSFSTGSDSPLSNQGQFGSVSGIRETPLEVERATKSPQQLLRSRLQRLIIFLILEGLWLGFGLIVHFYPVLTPSGEQVFDVGSFVTSSAAIFKSLFGSISILWYIVASLPMADLVQEIYSGEWYEILDRHKRRTGRASLNLDVDRVSTLISGRRDQFKHAFVGGDATVRYRLAFMIALFLLALHSLSPNSISISYVLEQAPGTSVPIGMLKPNLTQFEINTGITPDPFSNQRAQISQSTATELAQKAVRFEYVIQVEQSLPDFLIVNGEDDTDNNLLFGMPPRDIFLTMSNNNYDHMTYSSDAVTYNFSYQWLAPELAGNDPTTWSFGGDMTGVLDLQAIVNPVTVPVTFGIYPLDIISGTGAGNGSFAWFLFGLTNTSDLSLSNNSVDLGVSIDLSLIPEPRKNVGLNDWSAIVTEDGSGSGNVSTTASILYCDPGMKLGSADISIENSGSTLRKLDFRENKTSDVHSLDLEETSRMLGHSLNGIPWDTVVVTAQNTPSKLSRLAADLLFLPPEVDSFNTFSVYAPQSLENISSSLNAYTSIAGMSAYLDGSGSVGFVQAATYGFTNKQALVIAWPQWLTSVVIVISITILVGTLTLRDSKRNERLVPLTVATVMEEYHKLLPLPQEKM